MAGPAFQANAFQNDAYQASVISVGRDFLLQAPVFARPQLQTRNELAAQALDLVASSFGTGPVISPVLPLYHIAFTLTPVFVRPAIRVLHRLIANGFSLPAFDVAASPFQQNHVFFINAFSLSRSVFARPAVRRNFQLAAALAFDLDEPVFATPPPPTHIIPLRVGDFRLTPSFGFPGPLTTTVRARGWSPTYPTQVRAAMGILNGFLNLVLRSVPSTATGQAAPLLRLVAAMRANLRGVIVGNRLGTQLNEIMLAAETAGATYAGMEAARQYLMGFHASDQVFTQIIMRAALVMTIATQCKILARTRFTTQGEAQNAVLAIHRAFDEAKAIGIDQVDALVYRTLNTLGGAITAHLAATGLRLPRYVSYTNDMPMPSLYMAQRIYGDGSRHEEIEFENRIVHPAFCPMELRVLSDAGMWQPRYPQPERALPGIRQPGQFYGPAELPFSVVTR